jgi:medium-chain acyl-[acyl-carrier-protein] hydrolase
MGRDTISRSFDPAKWFVCLQPSPAAETRLFIFPYAGGSPAAFGKWNLGNVETQIAHYPGRGSRFNETPIREIESLVESLSLAIQPFLDKPFVFFGHSLGGLMAFELTRSLRRRHLPQPKTLFVSACGAPQLSDPHPPIHALPDDKLLEAVQKFNGIPFEILNQPEALKILLPIARADFEAVESYRCTDGEPLDIPIVALGGLDDPRVSREQLEGWAKQTAARFEAHYFPGDHFFINAETTAVMLLIALEIGASPAANPLSG